MRWRLRGVRIWNGDAERAPAGTWRVSGEGNRISGITPESEKVPPLSSQEREIDLSGRFLMPGLIDAHVHMSLDPTLKSPDEQFAVAVADRLRGMEERAARMLRAGITTARDLGGGDYAELDLRDRISRGEIEGPRLVCAGQPLTRSAGHCHFWGGGAETADEQRAVVERQLERGVDWIKIMATGGVFTKGTDVKRAQFDQAEIQATCSLASDAGRAVAAHCHGTAGIIHAANGGVRTVEHCSFVGEQGFGSDLDVRGVEALASSGTIVSPTMNLGWGRRFTDDDGRPSAFFARMSQVMHDLRAAGVPLIASTDAGIPGVAHHRLAEGMLAFQRYAALSNVELLRSATSGSADALGLEAVTGRILPGLEADLIAVARDPTHDPTTLLDPVWVMARGRVVDLSN